MSNGEKRVRFVSYGNLFEPGGSTVPDALLIWRDFFKKKLGADEWLIMTLIQRICLSLFFHEGDASPC